MRIDNRQRDVNASEGTCAVSEYRFIESAAAGMLPFEWEGR
jgi:hypothetical protein